MTSSCSLRLQIDAINKLATAGMHFWDYGNAFLLEASRAGKAITNINWFATVGMLQVQKLSKLEVHLYTHLTYKT